MEKLKEEIMYCTTCGAVNKKSAVFCEECKRKIVVRHRPIVDFLKKRAKGKITGDITESLFNLIKDFLYSHLYGIVLTVSVVVTGTVAVTNATPYIKKVTEPPFASSAETTEAVTEDTEPDAEYIEWCEGYATYIMSHYIDHSDAVIWAHDGYTVSEDTISTDEIYAERAIPGFNHQGAHEMMTVRVPLGMYHNGTPDSPDGVTEIAECIHGGYKFGESVESDLGQTLYAEGYEVMECVYEIRLHEGLESEGTLESVPVEMEQFRMLLVRYGDDWYVAEDVLTDRIKGDTYDLYMQYGAGGYEIIY